MDEVAELDLYQHTLRGDWGLAAVAWRKGSRHVFQFEDGELREFRADTPLMRRVSTERHQDAVRTLRRRLAAVEAQRRQQLRQRRVTHRVRSRIQEQIDTLLAEFPFGFRGDRWRVRVRGHGAKRHLKRHREPAILGAKQRLARLSLDQLVVNERMDTVHELGVATLRSSGLVPVNQVRRLEQLGAPERERFARALRDLLHGNGEFDERFNRFVEACDVWKTRPPTWELVTAPAALVHPREHFFVRPGPLLEQARLLDIPLALDARPNANDYRAALATARGLRESCVERGLRPVDLLDIHDFVRLTLPK